MGPKMLCFLSFTSRWALTFVTSTGVIPETGLLGPKQQGTWGAGRARRGKSLSVVGLIPSQGIQVPMRQGKMAGKGWHMGWQ